MTLHIVLDSQLPSAQPAFDMFRDDTNSTWSTAGSLPVAWRKRGKGTPRTNQEKKEPHLQA